MSVIDERAHRFLDSVEIPEGYKVELLNGEIILTPSGKPLHWEIQSQLLRQIWSRGGWEAAAQQTVRHPGFGDEPKPDVFVLASTVKVDPEGVYPAEHIELVVEVLSKSTKGTDLVSKVEIYGRFGIPLYLIIDPFKRVCTLHILPEPTGYEDSVGFEFGKPVPLPKPFGFALDTSTFPAYRSPDAS